MKKPIVITLVLLVLIGAVFRWQWLERQSRILDLSGREEVPPRATGDVYEKVRLIQGANAQSLGKGSPMDDLKILKTSLDGMILMIKDFRKMPVAGNLDFTAILTGGNSAGIRWLDRDHPAINEDGEIVDQWGSPIHFHRESWSKTTLRSAGPDKVFYSPDDLVFPTEE